MGLKQSNIEIFCRKCMNSELAVACIESIEFMEFLEFVELEE